MGLYNDEWRMGKMKIRLSWTFLILSWISYLIGFLFKVDLIGVGRRLAILSLVLCIYEPYHHK